MLTLLKIRNLALVDELAWELGAGLIGAVVALERKRPLRRQTRPVIPRTLHNVAMGLACAAVIEAVEKPLTERIAMRPISAC